MFFSNNHSYDLTTNIKTFSGGDGNSSYPAYPNKAMANVLKRAEFFSVNGTGGEIANGMFLRPALEANEFKTDTVKVSKYDSSQLSFTVDGISLYKNSDGISIVSTMTLNNSEEKIIKSLYLCAASCNDSINATMEYVLGKVILPEPIPIKPKEQKTFTYRIKF